MKVQVGMIHSGVGGGLGVEKQEINYVQKENFNNFNKNGILWQKVQIGKESLNHCECSDQTLTKLVLWLRFGFKMADCKK